MRYAYRPEAEADILGQYQYYLENATWATARRFLLAVEESVELITQMPVIGSSKTTRNRSLRGLRCWPVKDFAAMLIFYRTESDVVRIIRILHGRRNVAKILAQEKL